MRKKYKIIILIAAVLVTVVVLVINSGGGVDVDNAKKNRLSRGGFDFDETDPGFETFQELEKGCFGKDCIPSIDDPVFESVETADEWLSSTDIVFALRGKSSVKGYPQAILNLHEIVNDEFEGEPVATTFCPLCGSALAFKREVNGRVLEFGVSGFLHNSDLVMYDRQTLTLWEQITGEAVVGELTGTQLERLSFSGLEWQDFKEEFPNAQVLSRESGNRNYNYYPYGDYEQNQRVGFPVEGGVDSTIHPKEVVYGIELEDVYKAYKLEDIKNEGKIADEVNNMEITVDYNNGDIQVVDNQGRNLIPTRAFWFAWKAFHPQTELY